jgi:hypothetical protein
MTAAGSLDRGRAAFGRQAWGDAWAQLTAADREAALEPEDLERLAIAAHLVGRDAESTDAWARAHHAFLGRGAAPGAARCAFWLGFSSLIAGEAAVSGGWLARGQRLLDDGRHDCVERGYLLMLQALRCMWAGENATLHTTYDQAARIGERFGDAQLVAFGRLGVGEALIRSGQTSAGVAMLDEVMVAVTTGEVSAIGAGISTAPSSGNARRSSTCAGPRSGRRRSASGARRSRTSCPIAASAWCTAPRSCICKGPGMREARQACERLAQTVGRSWVLDAVRGLAPRISARAAEIEAARRLLPTRSGI